MQPRTTGRPIVPHGGSSSTAQGAGAYSHEFKPVTPRVSSLGSSGGSGSGSGGMAAQPVVARPLASYRPVAAASSPPPSSSSSSSDPFERKGVISTTLAEARALVQQMDNSRYNSSNANRPASLIEPSRPYTPRVSRRGSSSGSSPYTQMMMRPPSPSASPSSNHIPFPYPAAAHAFDGGMSGGLGPSASPPDSPSIHNNMANRSIASIIAKEEEEEELIIRSKKSSSLVRQRSFSRFSEDGSNGMGELDQMRSDSRPDSATLNRSRSASTASPMMMLSASSRKSPFQPSQSPPPSSTAVPELAFPASAGNDEDWKFVENSAGDETSRPGTAVPLQGWQSRQGSAGTTRAVQISQQLHVLHQQQQQQQLKENALQTSPQPRPPSGSPGSGTGRRSRPNSSSTTGAVGGEKDAGTATTNSRPTSSTSSTSTNSSIPSRPSSSSQSIKDQNNDHAAALTASPTPPPVPASTTRPSSALFSRPLDVKTPAAAPTAVNVTAGDVKEDAAEKVLDLAGLKALHEIYLSAAPLERPDALQNVLTASYRSLRAIQYLASPELEPLLTFVLELPSSIGAGDKLVLLISRLIFELSRDASNDAILVRMGPLVITSILSKPQRGLRALSFVLGAFHNLSVEASNNNAKPEQVSLLISPAMMEALINLMRESTLTKTLKLETEEEQVRLLVEVTALLRNIACINGAHRLFVAPSSAQTTSPTSAATPNSPSPSCLDLLCQLTVRLSQHSSLLLNLSRILSKLSLHQSCRAVMYQPILAPASAKQPQGFIPALVSSLQLHHVKLSLCVRVLYILGNLTMQNDVCRREIVDCSCVAVPAATGAASGTKETSDADSTDASAPAGGDVKGLEVLLALFARSYQRDSKLRKLIAGTAVPPSAAAAASPAVAAAAASANQKKHVSMLKENEDLLVKLIRLLANLSINPSIGSVVLSDKRCGFLLKLLKYKSLESAEELVLNTVSALTNLSFYLKMKPNGDSSRPPSAGTSVAASNASRPASATASKDSLVFFHPPRDVLALLLNYLFCSHVELLSEVCRALGNFSRDLSFRLLMQQARVDEAIILLLDHSDTGVVYGAAGVALNMAAHVQGQESLFQHDNAGVERLIEVMERFALHHQPEDAEEAAEEEPQAEWPLISMVLKTFLNLRSMAPAANGSGSSSSSLILKREVNPDCRMHLLEVLEAVLDRLEHELSSLRQALSEVSSTDADTDAESETSSIQAAIQQLTEVETLAQQLMPACIIPPQWQ